MAQLLHNLTAAAAAVAFLLGQMVCACLPASASHRPPPLQNHTAHSHAGHADESPPADPDAGGNRETGCGHCDAGQSATPNDIARLAAPLLLSGPLLAVLPSLDLAVPAAPFALRTLRWRWAAPPRATPVSLKVRLLN
ncbi:MAG: hypothetical protein ABL957_08930 [Parvularculaceae bacterium]